MYIGGFQKISLLDYPERICSIIFTVGCNFRCVYCYNRPLVLPEFYPKSLSFSEIKDYLKKRKGKIDAVVFTGGEPTIQPDLIERMLELKQLGFLIKLDTNGAMPEVINKCIKNGAVDYIAMDVKAPLNKYKFVTGVEVDVNKILTSIKIIKGFYSYEFRTTLFPGLKKEAFEALFPLLKGAKRYFLQECRLENTLKDCSHLPPFSSKTLICLEEKASEFVDYCKVRR
jgi:pyruvate formate lyase activating enzyme